MWVSADVGTIKSGPKLAERQHLHILIAASYNCQDSGIKYETPAEQFDEFPFNRL